MRNKGLDQIRAIETIKAVCPEDAFLLQHNEHSAVRLLLRKRLCRVDRLLREEISESIGGMLNVAPDVSGCLVAQRLRFRVKVVVREPQENVVPVLVARAAERAFVDAIVVALRELGLTGFGFAQQIHYVNSAVGLLKLLEVLVERWLCPLIRPCDGDFLLSRDESGSLLPKDGNRAANLGI